MLFESVSTGVAMSSDPQSNVAPQVPSQTDYEAIHAELMATQLGRWFLIEYATRHRHADTHMLLGAMARVESAVRGDAPPRVPAAVLAELSDVAGALGRIEAELAAGLPEASDGVGAAERIQDVAFTLREREFDTSLSDALEAAIRDLYGAVARRDVAAERARSVAALLRDLKSRVAGLIELALASGGDEASSLEGSGGAPLDQAVTLAAAEMEEDQEFAAAVGALAASLPLPEETGELPRTPQSEAGEVDSSSSAPSEGEAAAAPVASAPVALVAAKPAASQLRTAAPVWLVATGPFVSLPDAAAPVALVAAEPVATLPDAARPAIADTAAIAETAAPAADETVDSQAAAAAENERAGGVENDDDLARSFDAALANEEALIEALLSAPPFDTSAASGTKEEPRELAPIERVVADEPISVAAPAEQSFGGAMSPEAATSAQEMGGPAGKVGGRADHANGPTSPSTSPSTESEPQHSEVEDAERSQDTADDQLIDAVNALLAKEGDIGFLFADEPQPPQLPPPLPNATLPDSPLRDGPEEDPGGLFGPQPPRALHAEPKAEFAPRSSVPSVREDIAANSTRDGAAAYVATTPTRAVQPPPPLPLGAVPLAAVRALSEDELIALFS